MTEMEKMLAGEPFDFTAPDVAESLRRRRVNQAHFNAVSFDDGKAYDEALSALIPHRHPTARIMPPFYCDHGHRIQLGEGVFINAGCTFLDCGGITVGDHTLIGPGCRICTPQHPIDFEERRKPVANAAMVADRDAANNFRACSRYKRDRRSPARPRPYCQARLFVADRHLFEKW